MVAAEIGAEDEMQDENACGSCIFRCFYHCFTCIERTTVVCLYISICVSVAGTVLLGSLSVVISILYGACEVHSDALISMCPGLYLIQETVPDGAIHAVHYVCNCTTTVDSLSGACSEKGWSITDDFTQVCSDKDALWRGTMLAFGGESGCLALAIIMFGNLIKSSEHMGTLMEAKRQPCCRRLHLPVS